MLLCQAISLKLSLSSCALSFYTLSFEHLRGRHAELAAHYWSHCFGCMVEG